MLRAASGKGVHRVVQRNSDGRYYAGDGVWIDKPEHAKSFQSAMQVLQECGTTGSFSEAVLTECPENGELRLKV